MASSATEAAYPCSECDENPGDASTCCFECQAFLCQFHTEAHQRTKMTKTHKLEKIADLGPIAQQLGSPNLQGVPIDEAAPIFSTSSSSRTSGNMNTWAAAPQQPQWWGQYGAPAPAPTIIMQPIAVPVIMSPPPVVAASPQLPPSSPSSGAGALTSSSSSVSTTPLSSSSSSVASSTPLTSSMFSVPPMSPLAKPPVVPPRPNSKPPALQKPPSSPRLTTSPPPPTALTQSNTAEPSQRNFDEVIIRCSSDQNYVLDVNWWLFKVGSRLQLSVYNGTNSQRWKFHANGCLQNLAHDQTWCAELPWGKLQGNPVLIVFKKHTGASGRWSIDADGRIHSAVNYDYVIDIADVTAKEKEEFGAETLHGRSLTVKPLQFARQSQVFVIERCVAAASGSPLPSTEQTQSQPRPLPSPPTQSALSPSSAASLSSTSAQPSAAPSPVPPLQPKISVSLSPAPLKPPLSPSASTSPPPSSGIRNSNGDAGKAAQSPAAQFAANPVQTWAQLASGGMSRDPTDSQEAQVAENRAAAQQMQSQVEAHEVFGTSQPHLGAPQNFAELSDLVIEAALLPSPANLRANQNRRNGPQKGNGANNSNNGQPAQPPVEMHPMLKKFLASPYFQEQQKQIAQHAMSFLSIEPEQRWMQINWQKTPKDAVAEALRTGKPIFVEQVVGRLAQAVRREKKKNKKQKEEKEDSEEKEGRKREKSRAKK